MSKDRASRGQLVNVSDGYARNFLFPKNLAVPANADNMNKMIMQDKAKKAQMAAEKAEAQAIAEKLKGVMVKIPAKAGTGGRLFGAVTSKEISEALQAQFDLTNCQEQDCPGGAHQELRDLSAQVQAGV